MTSDYNTPHMVDVMTTEPQLRMRNLQSSDEESSAFFQTFVRITFVFLIGAIGYVIYAAHCRKGRAEDSEKKMRKAKLDFATKVRSINATNAIANSTGNGKASPYKLSISSPNNLAKIVFVYARSMAMADTANVGKVASCWSTTCLCLCLFILWLGFPGFILAVGSSEDRFMIPIVLLFFIIFPIVFIYLIRREYWQQMNPETSIQAVSEALDGRIVSNVQSSFLKSLEPVYDEEGGDNNTDRKDVTGFFDVTSFRYLQRAGYASVPSWALYSAAMEYIISTIARTNPEKEEEVRKIHNIWFEDILRKAARVYASFTDGLDDTRRRAMRRAQGQLLDVATGGLGGIINAANDVNQMKELTNQLRDILKDIQEIKKLNANASSVENVLTGELVPHTGYHPLPSKRYKYGIGSMVGALLLIAITSFMIDDENSTTAGGLVIGLALLVVVTGIYFSGKYNASHNAVEDMIDVEIRARKAMELAITGLLIDDDGLASSSQQMRDLIVATNDLRQLMMDNFYAALAIHAATEVFTARPAEYGDDAPMLFQTRDVEQGQDGERFPVKMNDK